LKPHHAPVSEPAQPVDDKSHTEDVDLTEGGKDGGLREEGEVKEPQRQDKRKEEGEPEKIHQK
jgi:hypothetical protein